MVPYLDGGSTGFDFEDSKSTKYHAKPLEAFNKMIVSKRESPKQTQEFCERAMGSVAVNIQVCFGVRRFGN